ncbi:MAG: hypothetical protein GYB65_15370 [Chloroflexi bacterium]|nr:hypothetical protein [Chloroflexota bacterium]
MLSTILTMVVLVIPPLVLLYVMLVRPWHLKWGATQAEVRRTFAGDDLVPEPVMTYTRAVTVQAPAERVWPWLVQIGYERGGWYSYDGLQRLVGVAKYVDGHKSANRIVPELQQLQVGDPIRLADDPAPAFTVHTITPNQDLILLGEDDTGFRVTWSFHLEERADGSTRLLARQRLVFPPRIGPWLMWRGVELPNFIMERKMLLGIKQRTEKEHTA